MCRKSNYIRFHLKPFISQPLCGPFLPFDKAQESKVKLNQTTFFRYYTPSATRIFFSFKVPLNFRQIRRDSHVSALNFRRRVFRVTVFVKSQAAIILMTAVIGSARFFFFFSTLL
uniref:Transmembrane protein n=1 Tax=Anguilla anguilla TaxID=7936 RepID=A0A0E9XE22_ANGAN